MQQAVTKHWRAAAWMLERAYPERFARRDPASLHARQARRLLNEVIDIIRSEIPDHYALGRLARRVRVVFDESIRAASDSRRTSRELRQALEFFERSEKPNNASASRGDDDYLPLPLPLPRERAGVRANRRKPIYPHPALSQTEEGFDTAGKSLRLSLTDIQ